MQVAAVLVAVAAVGSTLLGGLVALKQRDNMHLLLGLTGGIVLGVVAFELLPEVFELAEATGTAPTTAMIGLVCGFLVLHVVERSVAMHHAHEEEYGHHHHPQVGVISALALAAHSAADGIGIGLAFQSSRELGISVAIAVLAHDFADGLNTVGVMLAHDNSTKRSIRYLVLDAVAPLLGALSTVFITVPDAVLMGYLAFFAGFLLYLGSSDILPEAHSRHPSRLTLGCTLVGVAAMYGVAVTVGH